MLSFVLVYTVALDTLILSHIHSGSISKDYSISTCQHSTWKTNSWIMYGRASILLFYKQVLPGCVAFYYLTSISSVNTIHHIILTWALRGRSSYLTWGLATWWSGMRHWITLYRIVGHIHIWKTMWHNVHCWHYKYKWCTCHFHFR